MCSRNFLDNHDQVLSFGQLKRGLLISDIQVFARSSMTTRGRTVSPENFIHSLSDCFSLTYVYFRLLMIFLKSFLLFNTLILLHLSLGFSEYKSYWGKNILTTPFYVSHFKCLSSNSCILTYGAGNFRPLLCVAGSIHGKGKYSRLFIEKKFSKLSEILEG